MSTEFRFIPALTLAAAITIVYLALPRFIASLYIAYPKFVAEKLDNDGIKLANEAYDELITSINTANTWSPAPDHWQLLSRIQTERSFARRDQLSDQERNNALLEIETSISNGLKLAPIDPFAWYRFASIKHDLTRPPQEVLETLKMSMTLQPVAPVIMIRRLALMLDYKNNIDESTQALLQQQIKLAWQFKPKELTTLVAEHIDDKALFINAFNDSPEQAQRLENSLEQILKQIH